MAEDWRVKAFGKAGEDRTDTARAHRMIAETEDKNRTEKRLERGSIKGLEKRTEKKIENGLERRPGKKVFIDRRLIYPRRIFQFAAELLVVCALVAWLMYQSPWAMLIFVPAYPFYFRWRALVEERRRSEKLMLEFREMMTATAAALSAGYSMENALKEAERDTATLLGEKAEIVSALEVINKRIDLNEPAEKVLFAYAKTTHLEDIESFAEVFAFAKRSGGDYATIMRRTADTIQDKIDTSRDIKAVISEKKTEARIMDLVPLGIIFYLQISSPEFLQGLYGNLPGVILMSLCLVVYVAAVLFGEKLSDIRI